MVDHACRGRVWCMIIISALHDHLRCRVCSTVEVDGRGRWSRLSSWCALHDHLCARLLDGLGPSRATSTVEVDSHRGTGDVHAGPSRFAALEADVHTLHMVVSRTGHRAGPRVARRRIGAAG